MIEDKELGVKVAENKTEVLWNNIKTNCERDLEHLENELIVQKEILKLAISKLEK